MIIALFLIIGLLLGAVIGWLTARNGAATHHAEMIANTERLRATLANRDSEIAMLNNQIKNTEAQHRRDDEARQRQFVEQLNTAKEQLKNATAELLKHRAAELNESNSSQMSAIIEPLKEKIREMQQSMDASRETNTRNAASLHQALDEIVKRTASIGDEAGKLAKALRHENKTQGNWGEAILSELLESQGLHEGVHYDVQATIKDKHGRPVLNDTTDKRMIPDVILNYSRDKALIIDSKVSLSAFLDYTAAESDDVRAEAIERHIKSLRSHIKELSTKNYKRYILPPRESLDYVIMFVPNESALQLALTNDSTLWRDALAVGVFIAGEYNLIAALRIIRLAWIQEVQAEQQRKVFDDATLLVERIGEFYHHFCSLRERIDKLSEAYYDTEKKLIAGRQSIMVPAQRLKNMGYKEKERYPLPDPMPLLDEFSE